MLPRHAKNLADNMLDKCSPICSLPAGAEPGKLLEHFSNNDRGGIFRVVSSRRTPHLTKLGRGVDQSWPDWGHFWPNWAQIGTIRASFDQTLVNFGRIWRPARRNHSKTASAIIVRGNFDQLSGFRPAPRPARSKSASICRSCCSRAPAHFVSIFQRVQIEGGRWESRRSKSRPKWDQLYMTSHVRLPSSVECGSTCSPDLLD